MTKFSYSQTQSHSHFESRSLTEKSIKTIITEPLTNYSSLQSCEEQKEQCCFETDGVKKAAQS